MTPGQTTTPQQDREELELYRWSADFRRTIPGIFHMKIGCCEVEFTIDKLKTPWRKQFEILMRQALRSFERMEKYCLVMTACEVKKDFICEKLEIKPEKAYLASAGFKTYWTNLWGGEMPSNVSISHWDKDGQIEVIEYDPEDVEPVFGTLESKFTRPDSIKIYHFPINPETPQPAIPDAP